MNPSSEDSVNDSHFRNPILGAFIPNWTNMNYDSEPDNYSNDSSESEEAYEYISSSSDSEYISSSSSDDNFYGNKDSSSYDPSSCESVENLSSSKNNSDLMTTSASDISLPTTPSSSLHTDINKEKWSKGLSTFYKLNDQFWIFSTITYLWPIILVAVAYNVQFNYYNMQQFEIFGFGVIISTTTYLLFYIQETMMIAITPTVSDSILSCYPGKRYDYGLLIKTQPMYEYWIVYDNKSKTNVNLITVKNQNYDYPILQ